MGSRVLGLPCPMILNKVFNFKKVTWSFWLPVKWLKVSGSSWAVLRHGYQRCYVDPHDSFPTMCRWMRKVRVQRASEHGLGSNAQMVPNSIWPSELHESENMVVWHTCQSLHAIWYSPTRQQGNCMGLAMRWRTKNKGVLKLWGITIF